MIQALGLESWGLGRADRWLVALSLAVGSSVLSAQGLPPATGTPGVAGEMRTVAGRVLSGSRDSLSPVANQMVVLHRISADSSGPIDSARTSATGGYRFRYRLDGPRSMYIVSSRYAGIAYFTTPLRDGDRVELYRPLQCDPKAMRRQRAERGGDTSD